jgi:hypothetical protein
MAHGWNTMEDLWPIPLKTDLDLGKPLALNFARQFLLGDLYDVQQFSAGRAPANPAAGKSPRWETLPQRATT